MCGSPRSEFYVLLFYLWRTIRRADTGQSEWMQRRRHSADLQKLVLIAPGAAKSVCQYHQLASAD